MSDLIGECRKFAASHRASGETRTADLLERAAKKIDNLQSQLSSFTVRDRPGSLYPDQSAPETKEAP